MTQGLFVTGTDTHVGKTFASCILIASLRREGINVGVMKPVESGCSIRKGKAYPLDGARLRRAAGTDEPLERITPYALLAPLAPHLAALKEGVVISIQRILDGYSSLARKHRFMLVEGAGGILAPLTVSRSVADLATALELPLLVVAANRLGVLNHTLLTLESAARRGLSVCGVLLNNAQDRKDPSTETNPDTLSRILAQSKVPFWGVLDHFTTAERQRVTGLTLRHGIGWSKARSSLGLTGGSQGSPEVLQKP
jgi:dethiobiotin synthetase